MQFKKNRSALRSYKRKNQEFTCLHLCFVGLLCVEAETFSWPCSASSTCPLLGRSFTDGGDEQGLDSDTRIVHLGEDLILSTI